MVIEDDLHPLELGGLLHFHFHKVASHATFTFFAKQNLHWVIKSPRSLSFSICEKEFLGMLITLNWNPQNLQQLFESKFHKWRVSYLRLSFHNLFKLIPLHLPFVYSITRWPGNHKLKIFVFMDWWFWC